MAVMLLMNKGAALDIKDNTQRSILHHAAKLSDASLLKLFVDTSLDVNDKDRVRLCLLELVS
jgi:ankyrin repeat protein